MVLKRIGITRLFGIYDYELNLIDKSLSNVTIIDAPNGMGKTTLLRLINAAIIGDLDCLESIPFDMFDLQFDNGAHIFIESGTNPPLLDVPLKDAVRLLRPRGRKEKDGTFVYLSAVYENIRFVINGKNIPIMFQGDFLNSFRRRVRLRVEQNRILNDQIDVLVRDEYQAEDIFDLDNLHEKLHEALGEYSVLFIKANRLFSIEEASITNSQISQYGRSKQVPTVEVYQKQIKDQIIRIEKLFANKSEELDRSFPQRVLNIIFNHSSNDDIFTEEEIDIGLRRLGKERIQLSKLGLISKYKRENVKVPKTGELSIETRIFLTNYIKDSISKLEVYKDIAERLRLFRDIINDRNCFSNKTMSFNSEEGIIFTYSNRQRVPIDRLSSGEQNNLVIFYELIFGVKENSLVLIDEPEISLHVFWQRQFIDELIEICKLKGLQSIVATHSPDIVGNYVDYMVDLEDISDGEE